MASNLPIPVFDSLAEIYPSQSAVLREGQRWNELVSRFKELYGHAPSHIIRAPGRVNILGEHIDYSLFPVLPAAIEQDILLALHTTDTPRVQLANLEPKFKPCAFDLTPPSAPGSHAPSQNGHGATRTPGWHVDFVSPAKGGGWENYVKVATAECLDAFFGPQSSRGQPRGMDLVVSGTVPPGSGLSSSAAFVVGSVITFLVANGITEGVSKGDVTMMAMASEHRMGLRTGGMDQAASALALPNTLLHLSFFPSLSPVPLPLPKGLAVVISNSLAPHALADSAPVQYNLRVVESLCAARVLLHAWGLTDHPRLKDTEKEDWKLKTGEGGRLWLREVLELKWPGRAEKGEEQQMYEEARTDLQGALGADGRDKKGWTREEMIAVSGMSEDDFSETYLHFLEVRAERFHLYQRALHALDESIRVSRFTAICRSFADEAGGENASALDTADPRVAELGELLVQSHMSCKDVYECTCPETDALMRLCMDSGAIGARQTGGGWGGAVISLVQEDKAQAFLADVKAKYPKYQNLTEAQQHEAAFATLPGNGAGVYRLEDGATKA